MKNAHPLLNGSLYLLVLIGWFFTRLLYYHEINSKILLGLSDISVLSLGVCYLIFARKVRLPEYVYTVHILNWAMLLLMFCVGIFSLVVIAWGLLISQILFYGILLFFKKKIQLFKCSQLFNESVNSPARTLAVFVKDWDFCELFYQSK